MLMFKVCPACESSVACEKCTNELRIAYSQPIINVSSGEDAGSDDMFMDMIAEKISQEVQVDELL